MHAKWNAGPSNRETDDGPIRMREKWNRSGTEDRLAGVSKDDTQIREAFLIFERFLIIKRN